MKGQHNGNRKYFKCFCLIISIFQHKIHIPLKFTLMFKESETKFNRNTGRHEMGHPREERVLKILIALLDIFLWFTDNF